ncbi:malate:quinone oxidoreductase, partial [Proteus mirabilis]|uniref:malate:quinone oxidoreductase n=1 Tax=Proteus mirabilis TaxID=584 RepID=UPI0025781FE3
DNEHIEDWAPLIMEGRDPNQELAVTRVATGTDVDYVALTHLLVKQLSQQDYFELHYKHDVIDIKRTETGGWNFDVKDL